MLPFIRPFVLLAATGCLLPPIAGCRPGAAPKQQSSRARKPIARANDRPAAEQEVWDAHYIQGSKVGYGRWASRTVERDGRTLVELEAEQRLSLQRMGQPAVMDVKLTSLETPDGKLQEFTSKTNLGAAILVTTGRVHGNTLELAIGMGGESQTSLVPWPDDARGFFATEQSLRKRPMQPGERRTFEAMQPVLNSLCRVELTAGEYETTELLSGKKELLRIEHGVVMPGGARIDSTIWTDRDGEIMKMRTAGMDQVSYRTTREIAQGSSDESTFDLALASTVRLDRPLADPHGSRQIRYRVELPGGDPAAVFVSSPRQQVTPLGPHSAEMVVRAVRAGEEAVLALLPQAPAPDAADLERSPLVQSDDARIISMAREAAGDAADPLQVALSLEQYVYSRMRERTSFTTAFASAAEVAQSLSGDCTERAVLLAALARARGIPSRVAIGLVYSPGEQGFAYHMWNELYLEGRWIPLDATLGLAGIGPTHLKLAESNLAGPDAYSSFLPVAQVLGRLKIEVLEVQQD